MAIDQAAFARKVIKALRKRRRLDGDIAYDAATFGLTLPDASRMFLGNLFADWSAAPWYRKRGVIAHYLSAVGASNAVPTDRAAFRASLRIQLRDTAWLELNRDLMAGDHPRADVLPATPLCPELALAPVIDSPTAMASVTATQLREHGLSVDDAVQLGRANLRAHSPRGFQRLAPGVFTSATGDSYDASRLVLTELIARLDLRGDPVALVPSRDQLLITGSDDDVGLATVAAAARPLLDRPRAITGQAFVWRSGAWSAFLPPPAHPAHLALRELAVITDARAAADQKAQLEAVHADDPTAPFVATFTVMAHQDTRALASHCVWTEGVDTLLPRTDHVVLLGRLPDGELGQPLRVPWASLQARAGHLMADQGTCPARWRVAAFPSATELAALAADAVPFD
ncbi:MAG: hypothetical protein R3B06_15460 [Kofleriaceae bacterium]